LGEGPGTERTGGQGCLRDQNPEKVDQTTCPDWFTIGEGANQLRQGGGGTGMRLRVEQSKRGGVNQLIPKGGELQPDHCCRAPALPEAGFELAFLWEKKPVERRGREEISA